MKIEKIEPVYKSTFNSKSNQNKNNNQSKQNKKDKATENPAVILQISKEARKKLNDSRER